MRNFEKAVAEGMKILKMHPNMDLHASEMEALLYKYSGNIEKTFYAISDMWMAGLAAGYKMGKKDAAKSKSVEIAQDFAQETC